ncbi:MAG: hypothetical protein ACO0C9_00265 [Candidatus Methanosuratincola verstraetei]
MGVKGSALASEKVCAERNILAVWEVEGEDNPNFVDLGSPFLIISQSHLEWEMVRQWDLQKFFLLVSYYGKIGK